MGATPGGTLANPEQLVADLRRQLAECKAERDEALAQQTATAEVLQVINSSPGDLAPVFDAILEKAMRLCEAAFGGLWMFGDRYVAAALRGVPQAYADFLRESTEFPGPGTAAYRFLHGEQSVIHNLDLANEEAYLTGQPLRVALVDLGGARTAVQVPLLKDGGALGLMTIYRQEVRPFSERQIGLLQNFAAQAVIAMENARLINETREALEQQTATAEVLGAINSSSGDLAPVFRTILEKAHILCEAAHGHLTIYNDDLFRIVAMHGIDAVEPIFAQPFPAEPSSLQERLLRGERLIHIADIADDTASPANVRRQMALEAGFHTVIFVPLRKDEVLVGYITAYRQEVRPFTDKQIALLQNFAAQAVIAIENARLLTETRHALEQQTATAEVLGVINSSLGDLKPVFSLMLEKALRLCGADLGNLLAYDGECFEAVVGVYGATSVGERELARGRFRPAQGGGLLDRLVEGEHFIHTENIRTVGSYQHNPEFRNLVDGGGYLSMTHVALRKGTQLLGVIVIFFKEHTRLTEKQIALLKNFADQAVIAMENARLITETSEALEQQTATAEVLRVINTSPGDLAPVFEAILEKAHTLCDVAHGSLQLYDGEKFRAVAVHGLSEALAVRLMRGYSPNPSLPNYKLLEGAPFVQIADLAAIDVPLAQEVVKLGGTRTHLLVALRKESTLLGQIVAARKEVRPFTDKQIALLQNFAAQAVIAMENARLITETREALEQQTATAEVLKVINSSPGDLAPVFDAMLERAVRLCEANFGIMNLYEGDRFIPVALRGVPDGLTGLWTSVPPEPGPHNALSRMVNGEDIVHIQDLASYQSYLAGDPRTRSLVEVGGARSLLAVTLRKDGKLLGTLTAYRQDVRPFADKQIALLQNFAAQAVIAMENARLLTETREALEQQTATAEVLGVINSSPGDLAPVFQAMLERAMQLCNATFGGLWMFEEERYVAAALRGIPAAYAEFLANSELAQPGPGTAPYRLRHGESVVHNVDLAAEEPYRAGEPNRRALVDLGGARTALQVSLRKDNAVLGVITIYRQEVRPFSEKQIALLQNFAAQAVIAIENARLITETREALEQQTATAEVLGVINSAPGDLAPVFDAILEKAMHLCGAAFGELRARDGDSFRSAAARGVPAAFAEYRRGHAFVHEPGSLGARILAGEQVVHVLDLKDEDVYRAGYRNRRALVDLGGARTALVASLRKDGTVLGFIIIYRQEVRPFTDKQIALVKSFADQAVIAMENARLLGELRQRTEEVAELNRGLEARVADQVEELGRVGRLKRFLAPQLAELIVSQGDEKILESHRREIVVVFCDVRGYTAFTETAEPEEVLDFLREYHGALGPLVSQFEGTLDQFSGDGIMVFFNDPIPIPDPAERAVKMAVAMREAASALIAAWRERGRKLGFGVGIAQGYATLGQIGFSERSGYTAIGTVCNVAARLCAEAKDGQILLSQRVNAALRGGMATEQVGALALRGLTQPVVAYNVPLAGSQPALRIIDGGTANN